MQKHLIEHAAKHVAIRAARCTCSLHRLGNSAAKAARGAGMLLQNLSAHSRGGRGRGSDVGTVGTHDLTAEGLLLIADLDHEDLAIKTKVRARHGECCAPLACTGFGGHAFQSLHLCIVRLRNRGIELMAAAGIVTFKLIVDMCGSVQLLFQAICTDKRCGTVHFIKIDQRFGDIDIGRGVIQLLTCQLLAEHLAHGFQRNGLHGAGIDERRGLFLHVRAHVVPLTGDFVFG